MNEYRITVDEDGRQHQVIVLAETAARAREQVEDSSDGDIVALEFVRALSFSCRMRGG